MKLGRLPIEFLYTGPVRVLIVGDALEIVAIIFLFSLRSFSDN